MTFNKLIWNIAVDSNHLINMNKVLKWHFTYVFDHTDSQSTASLVSQIVNLLTLQAVKAQRPPAYVGFSMSLSLHICKCALYIHIHILIESSDEPLFTGTTLTLACGYPTKKAVHRCLDNFVEMVG